MDQEILKKLESQQEKLDKIYRSVEKTRKYFLWTMIITVLMVFLPLVGLFFVIPGFLQSFNYSALGL